MDRRAIRAEGEGNYAIGAEELRGTMGSVFMSSKSRWTIKSSLTSFVGDRVDVLARVWGEFEMVGSDVSLESLMFAKGLLAWRVVFTPESLMALVGSDMSSKSGGRKEALCAILPSTLVFSFVGVRTLNVCLQMLVLEVRLVTILVCAYECPLVCVYLQMRLQTNGSVERLGTTWVGAFQGLQFRGKLLSSWGEGGAGGIYGSSVVREVVWFVFVFVLLVLLVLGVELRI